MKKEEARAYQLIINAIAAGSKVEVTEDHIFIHSQELSAPQLEQLLVKPKHFKNVVGKYVFVPADNIGLQYDSIPQALTSRSTMPKMPHDFLKVLFGDVILKNAHLHEIDQHKLTEVEGNLIYPLEDYSILKGLWDERVKMLKRVLQNAGISGIAEVFSSGKPLELSSGQSLDSELTQHMEDIIGIKANENSNAAFFYLNKRFLFNMVVAPEVQEVVCGDSKTIRIDKSQFSDYLGRVFGGMVIPKQELQYNEHSDASSIVTPVIIPRAVSNSLNKQNIYIFVIDVSSSLQKVAEKYKEQLMHIVEKLVTVIKDSSADGYVNSQDLIRLVFFSDKSTYIDFPVTAALSNVENLKQAIMATPINGYTLLDGTIKEQIDSLDKLCGNKESCNVNMFIFTDGEDNRSSAADKISLNQHGDRFRAQETEVIPKFKIFRVGNANVPKIEAISTGIDAEILDIADVDGLSQLFDNIRDLNVARELITFVQETHKTTLAVYEGRLTTGPDLDTSKEVEIAGKKYDIEPSSTHIADGIKMRADTQSFRALTWQLQGTNSDKNDQKFETVVKSSSKQSGLKRRYSR